MDIETAATSAIKSRIADTDRLSQYINERDKEPIWDGSIYAYKGKRRSNNDIVGRAPVQVKGKTVKTIKKEKITYPVSVINLEKYRDDGGVIYFVVYIDESRQKRIYYARLLPFVLNQYISVAHGKKISIPLKMLPDEDYEFENIVLNFISDSEKQGIVRNGHIWTFDEVAKLFGSENFELNFTYTGIGYDRSNPFSFLRKNEIYMYAQNKEKTITIPIHHIEHIDMQVEERYANINVGEVSYKEKIAFSQYSSGKVELLIGKSMRFIYEEGKSVFKYNLTGDLNERILTIKTLLSMMEQKYVCVDSVKIDISPNPHEVEAFNLEERKQQLKYYELIKETLTRLHVSKSLEIERLTEKEENNLRMLVNAVLYERPASFKENGKIPPVCTLDFANLKIVMAFRQNKDGKYIVEDFFDTNMVCAIDKNDEYRTTPFCILQKDDYLKDDNLVLDKVINGFKQFDNEGHFEKMVLCILEMIKAYDENTERNDLLQGAKNLCEWMSSKKSDDVIHRINYLQCCQRERKLTDDEINELAEIIVNRTTDNSTIAGAHILLGNKAMAVKHLGMLSREQKEAFEKYPIYTLYKRI